MTETTLAPAATLASREPARARTFAATLMAPWYATKRQTLWVALVMFALGCGGALAAGIFIPDTRGQTLVGILYGAGVAFVWAFWLSGMLLVARDGWRLAVPHAARNATTSALLYALITLVLPLLPAAVLGWNLAPLALIVALAMVTGLAFVLLPRWIAVWLGFLPAVYSILHDQWHLAAPTQPGFLRWGGLLLLALLVSVAWRWWRLLRAGSDDIGGWNSPMLFQLRKQAVTSTLAFDKQLFWRDGKHQNQYMTLHGIDARAPAKAIEVALGAMFVPRSALGNLRRLAALAWPMAAFGVGMLLVSLDKTRSLQRVLGAGVIGGAMWGGLFGTSMAMFGLYTLLQRRWDTGVEPALLALLPGLGLHAPLHRSVARAAFTKPIAVCGGLWLLMVACEGLAHFGAPSIALTTATSIVICLLTAGLLLRAFAGRPLRTWLLGLIATGVFALMMCSMGFAIVTALKRTDPTVQFVVWALVATWTLGAIAASIFALRAWRAFSARPHPFLAR